MAWNPIPRLMYEVTNKSGAGGSRLVGDGTATACGQICVLAGRLSRVVGIPKSGVT